MAVFHIIAITIASIPPPREIVPSKSRQPPPDHWPANRVGPMLDRAAAGAANAEGLWRLSSPIRRVAGAYTRMIGLEQRWNMFSEPPDKDQYAHMRYYVQGSGSGQATRTERELIFPAGRGERSPFFGGSFFEEKAIRNARQRFYRRIREDQTLHGVEDLPKDLLPVIRYSAGRYQQGLLEGEMIVRAELWLGSAAVPPPGAVDGQSENRGRVLDAYYDGAQPTWRPDMNRAIGTQELEGDITWTLMYFEEWN